jgi:hypothetical protein
MHGPAGFAPVGEFNLLTDRRQDGGLAQLRCTLRRQLDGNPIRRGDQKAVGEVKPG